MPIKRPIKPTDGRLKKNREKRAKMTASKAAASKTMKRTKRPMMKRKR